MAANQGAAPIIIKKIKKGGHAHHGGAWKVAFADFVTAMMAFFMLMWLMSSTTVEERAAISSYFNDPMATTGYSGNGAGNPALNGGDGILAGRGVSAWGWRRRSSSSRAMVCQPPTRNILVWRGE